MTCNEAIRLDPDVAGAYLNRGEGKVGLGLKDEARKDFGIALELARKAGDARKLRDILEVGMTRAEVSRATELARVCMTSDYQDCEP